MFDDIKRPNKAALQKLFGNGFLPNDIDWVVQFVTSWMIVKYRFKKANDINYGYCFIWAYFVWCLMPEGSVVFRRLEGPGHVIIEHAGKFYDSNNLSGMKSVRSWTKVYGSPARKEIASKNIGYWLRYGLKKEEFWELIKRTVCKKDRDRLEMYV
jgi:hypothetical protein